MTSSTEPSAQDVSGNAISVSLDTSLERPWPEDVVEAARRFKLGDVIEAIPLHYVRHESRRLWNSSSTDPAIGSLIQAGTGTAPRLAIITTQTCDLVDEGRDEDQPWFQVCPIIEYAPEVDVPRRNYLHRLTTSARGGATWVADLRIEVPIEKTLLLDREPIPGFASEDDEVGFANVLGRRRDRAALADGINRCLYRPFVDKRRNNRNRGRRVKAALHSIGLVIEEGNRLEPKAVAVHFIGVSAEPSGDERAWLEEWWDNARVVAENADRPFRLLMNTYHRSDAMDLAVYDNLVILNWL